MKPDVEQKNYWSSTYKIFHLTRPRIEPLGWHLTHQTTWADSTVQKTVTIYVSKFLIPFTSREVNETVWTPFNIIHLFSSYQEPISFRGRQDCWFLFLGSFIGLGGMLTAVSNRGQSLEEMDAVEQQFKVGKVALCRPNLFELCDANTNTSIERRERECW